MEKYLEKMLVDITKNEKAKRLVLSLFNEPVCDFEFKKKHSLEERIMMYKNLKKNHPAKIPVVIENPQHKKILKLMVDWDEKVMRLFINIRNQYGIPIQKAIFLVTEKGTILMGSQCMGDIFRDYSFDSEDMFIYLRVEFENTFGN
jgi:hypothetical protein